MSNCYEKFLIPLSPGGGEGWGEGENFSCFAGEPQAHEQPS